MAYRRYKERDPAMPEPATSALATEAPAGSPIEGDANPLKEQLAHLQEAEAQQATGEQTAEQAIDSWQISERKKQFLKAHPELLNPAVAEIGRSVHARMLSLGIEDDSDQMNAMILHGVRSAIASRAAEEAAAAALPPAPAPAQSQRRSIPMAAPVSRDPYPASSGRYAPSTHSVRLSVEEREMARLSGISETEYARNKLRLERLKREQGLYNEQG
jgi:hypothetical protein